MRRLRFAFGLALDLRAGLVAYARIVRDSTRYAMQERLEWLAGSLDVDYPDDDCCLGPHVAEPFGCGRGCEFCYPAPDDVSALDDVVDGFGCGSDCVACNGGPA